MVLAGNMIELLDSQLCSDELLDSCVWTAAAATLSFHFLIIVDVTND